MATTNVRINNSEVDKPRIPGLERSDFVVPARQLKSRIIYSVQGRTKTGKSTFPFWGPSPIAVFDFDRRLEGVVQKAMSGKLTGAPKEIVYIPFKMPKYDIRSKQASTELSTEGRRMMDTFIKNFIMALESSLKPGGIRTISIDTGTELADVRLMSEFGRLVGIQPRDRGGVNQDMRTWMRMGEDYNANVCWIHHVKDKWVDDKNTGEQVIDGYNKAEQCTQVNLRTDVRGDKFTVRVLDSGLNPATNGKTYSEQDWGDDGPFAFISQLQMPKTDIEDWLDEE